MGHIVTYWGGGGVIAEVLNSAFSQHPGVDSLWFAFSGGSFWGDFGRSVLVDVGGGVGDIQCHINCLS